MSVSPLFILGIGWDIVEDVRGTVAMLMFIMEEASQTAMMGEWIAVKEDLRSEAMNLNLWIRQYLTGQLYALADSNWSLAAYPLNNAYGLFALACNKTLDIYTEVIRKRITGGS
jgi:hypothetical protein